jgi:hypothetical protein
MVIQPGATHPGVIERKTQRLDQMELRPGVGTQADDVAGIRRDFRFDQYDVKHLHSSVQ